MSSEQRCELNSLDVALDILGVEKVSSQNFSVAVNTGGHSIRVLNERKVSHGGNLCPLWLEILKSLSVDILCSLLCRETDWEIRIGNRKQGCVLILTDFKSGVFIFHS